jgi:hypothetical protein
MSAPQLAASSKPVRTRNAGEGGVVRLGVGIREEVSGQRLGLTETTISRAAMPIV